MESERDKVIAQFKRGFRIYALSTITISLLFLITGIILVAVSDRDEILDCKVLTCSGHNLTIEATSKDQRYRSEVGIDQCPTGPSGEAVTCYLYKDKLSICRPELEHDFSFGYSFITVGVTYIMGVGSAYMIIFS